ncbi:MAG: anti-repressor SinI family protein [Anaerobacillus sp.]
MAMAKIMPQNGLDQEWVILMRAARELGLQKEEIRAYLSECKKTTTKSLHK